MTIFKHNFGFIVFVCALTLNILFWQSSRNVQAQWGNVPPAPSSKRASMTGLSDAQFAYRMNGLMLQNLGSVGGQGINLRDYNYGELKKWFFVQDSLDEYSNFTPLIAAHYYGAVDDTSKLGNIFDYLKIVGARPYGEKWRWLGHAVYLARYSLKDNDVALELAEILAANKDPKIGIWARQMPALIHQADGNKEEAYAVMLNILKDSLDDMHPNEINFMKDYICNTILEGDPLESKPLLCQ
tara:strand:+ start:322 stop:1044 length:723 start_codon:yes stop_codon:yes gene_type:complete